MHRMKIKVEPLQTFEDIALIATGIADNAFAIAFFNAMSPSDELVAGTILNIPEGLEKDVNVLNYYATHFKNENGKPEPIIPGSAATVSDEEEENTGIDFWAIDEDFEVQ
jgi:hypothetical protein